MRVNLDSDIRGNDESGVQGLSVVNQTEMTDQSLLERGDQVDFHQRAPGQLRDGDG